MLRPYTVYNLLWSWRKAKSHSAAFGYKHIHYRFIPVTLQLDKQDYIIRDRGRTVLQNERLMFHLTS